MEKSADAFRTISEVAEDLDLPQHVLRFWETRFIQIRPMKRGGGRRYYRPDDVDLLSGIKHLLYGEGYTIKGVQRILKEEGLRYVQAVGREGTLTPSEMAGAAAPVQAPTQAAPPSATPTSAPHVEHSFTPSPFDNAFAGEDAFAVSDGDRVTGAPRPVSRAKGPGLPLFDAMPGELGADRLDALRSALDELTECRRLLASATDENESDFNQML